ncbi:N-acetylmuramoyl-L-alanine amidase [Leisingera aquaemixtae]|uniref:N-acetylmuramoyl-L-alanine amidase n=1 Tax=Leisingera aquaemixtae TaxID=1396826 RepID=A0ABY5WF11_9RHOB|nr:N-acetylmuramoyl-L-alanine amidase [Leisingera aquaemixtae]UWQ40042.1 N-acetylmuramoyl-L-alanine amidase [Leisingera aquaemixtae]
MGRLFSFSALIWLLAAAAWAQGFSGLARIDAEASRVRDAGQGAEMTLGLSQGVPYRLFTLDGPPRLVLDFQEVDWTGLTADKLVQGEQITAAQFGTYVPGWSRLVLQLAQPMKVSSAAMRIDQVTAAARLAVLLEPATAEEFAASAGAPQDPRWDLPAPQEMQARAARDENAPLLVMLDPGHGGIDPGAETEVVIEKHLMLQFAGELGEALLRSGQFTVMLTRDDDYFVSLERRIAMAHQAGADVFISLHADTISEGRAHGSTVYTLSREASDAASAKLAERHLRGDLLSGTDLSQADDRVTGVMLDLARQETQPRSDALAAALIDGLRAQGKPINNRPLRSAGFSVLKSADIPSVLVEIGFLSSKRDLKNLVDADWRAKAARGILNGLITWRAQDDARRALVRK